MWAELLVVLQQHLALAIPDADVRVGGDASVPEVRSIVLLRGDGDAAAMRTTKLKQTLYAELWEFDNDDQANAYMRLADLERQAFDALLNLNAASALAGWNVSLRLGTIESDSDAFRPSVGSRVTITVDAYRSDC